MCVLIATNSFLAQRNEEGFRQLAESFSQYFQITWYQKVFRLFSETKEIFHLENAWHKKFSNSFNQMKFPAGTKLSQHVLGCVIGHCTTCTNKA